MFTGIVSAVGRVIEIGPNRLGIDHAPTARKLKRGVSVAVNGCCLTVVKKSRTAFYADVVPETLRRTNLGGVKLNDPVNLELPLPANGLLDGHLVQGHVDAIAPVKRVTPVAAGREIVIALPSSLRRFVAEKGSIAADGVSLTVAAIDDKASTFTVALIPHTLAETIAGNYKRGSIVNLEADVVARYVARNLHR
ncbi:MAG TPA: riboflavin synthase [Candidatus Dormibacteraeota bacterium]|nr:riboflavin synthase [Candidatus Dormibacteraeota bacterium]